MATKHIRWMSDTEVMNAERKLRKIVKRATKNSLCRCGHNRNEHDVNAPQGKKFCFTFCSSGCENFVETKGNSIMHKKKGGRK